jgi:hypothetical protein
MKPSVLYFAHPINTYGTDLEEALLQRIAQKFNGCRIVNPSAPEHQAKYLAYMAKGAKEMDYFIELAMGCDECVLLAFRDRMIGAGVYKEAAEMHRHGCPVWEILPSGEFFTWAPDPARRLSVEATIARIRLPDLRPLPY